MALCAWEVSQEALSAPAGSGGGHDGRWAPPGSANCSPQSTLSRSSRSPGRPWEDAARRHRVRYWESGYPCCVRCICDESYRDIQFFSIKYCSGALPGPCPAVRKGGLLQNPAPAEVRTWMADGRAPAPSSVGVAHRPCDQNPVPGEGQPKKAVAVLDGRSPHRPPFLLQPQGRLLLRASASLGRLSGSGAALCEPRLCCWCAWGRGAEPRS